MIKRKAMIAGLTIGLILSTRINNDINRQYTDTSGFEAGQTAKTLEPILVTQEIFREEPKLAKVTAYTCDPTMTAEQKALNCPNGITATGTTPKAFKTVACPRKYIGSQFYIEDVGIVTCEDVGGAIKGEARFDLYMDTYAEAIDWGTKYKSYEEV